LERFQVVVKPVGERDSDLGVLRQRRMESAMAKRRAADPVLDWRAESPRLPGSRVRFGGRSRLSPRWNGARVSRWARNCPRRGPWTTSGNSVATGRNN